MARYTPETCAADRRLLDLSGMSGDNHAAICYVLLLCGHFGLVSNFDEAFAVFVLNRCNGIVWG